MQEGFLEWNGSPRVAFQPMIRVSSTESRGEAPTRSSIVIAVGSQADGIQKYTILDYKLRWRRELEAQKILGVNA